MLRPGERYGRDPEWMRVFNERRQQARVQRRPEPVRAYVEVATMAAIGDVALSLELEEEEWLLGLSDPVLV